VKLFLYSYLFHWLDLSLIGNNEAIASDTIEE
jgi:hypothetical protein